MHSIVVIQARMGSTRLPGKAMIPLDGKPALVHEINRAAAVGGISREDVVVATSKKPRDDVLEFTAKEAGATVYRGSETNVLHRIADAVRDRDADLAVRKCGDNTLIAPRLLATLRDRIRTMDVGYASSKFEHTFPIGHNADAFTKEMIVHAADVVDSEHHEEHVAQFFKDNRETIAAVNVKANEMFDESFIESVPAFRQLRLTLDEAADYRFLSRVYEDVAYDEILDTRDAIEYIVRNDLREINQEVDQQVW